MAQLAWHTSVSILAAGAMVAGAVYLALRSSPEPTVEPATEVAARPPNQPAANSAMAERDRQRRWDEWAEAEGDDSPAPVLDPPARRNDDSISEAQKAMAVAEPMLGLPPVPDTLGERVERDATQAFEGIRERVRSECWNALPDDPEAPDAVNVKLALSYSAEGKVLASGVSESREGSRAGLTACLGPLVHELDVPAPGSHLSIELKVAIP